MRAQVFKLTSGEVWSTHAVCSRGTDNHKRCQHFRDAARKKSTVVPIGIASYRTLVLQYKDLAGGAGSAVAGKNRGLSKVCR